MQDPDDRELLRRYTEEDSEESFAALVTRHVDKVYSIALRHTGNLNHAEEITQAVFVILARKSRSLSPRVVLSGWLYQTARLTAVTFVRTEIRRARREQEAIVETNLDENASNPWPQIAPLLDTALSGLNERDRQAVLLRYFDGKSLREVGAILGASEDAAKMRVNRAVDKLRILLKKRGVDCSASALSTVLAANSVQAAPAVLAKTATAVALVEGAMASTSVMTLVTGVSQRMVWVQVRSRFAAAAGLLFLAAIAAVAFGKLNRSPSDYAYTVQGNVELKSLRRSPDGLFYYDVETNGFEIQVQNDQWLIHLGSQRPEVYDYRVVSSDGISTYLLLSYETREKTRITAGQKPLNIGDANIVDGNIPRFIWAPEAGALWIAYASSGHLAERRSGFRKPVPFADYMSDSYGPLTPDEPPQIEDAAWVVTAEPPGLPMTLHYSRNGRERPPGLPHGPAETFTNVVYRALSHLDFGGLRLPRESAVSIYRKWSPTGTEATNQLGLQIRVWATNVVRGVELKSFQPKLPGLTMFLDCRVAEGQDPVTSFSSYFWPEKPAGQNSPADGRARPR